MSQAIILRYNIDENLLTTRLKIFVDFFLKFFRIQFFHKTKKNLRNERKVHFAFALIFVTKFVITFENFLRD